MNYIQDILKKKKVKEDDGADEKLDSFTDAQKAKFEKIFDSLEDKKFYGFSNQCI